MTDTPLTLELAQPDDAAALADISRRAFETDSAVGGTGPGGPPGYDTAAWQRSMISQKSSADSSASARRSKTSFSNR